MMPPTGPGVDYQQRLWFKLVDDISHAQSVDDLEFKPIASYLASSAAGYLFKLLRCADGSVSEEAHFMIGVNDKFFAVGGIPRLSGDKFRAELQACLNAVFPSVGRKVSLEIIPVTPCVKPDQDGNVLAVPSASLAAFLLARGDAQRFKKAQGFDLDDNEENDLASLFSLARSDGSGWLVLLPWPQDTPNRLTRLQDKLARATVEANGSSAALAMAVQYSGLELVPHCILDITFHASSSASPLMVSVSPRSLGVPILSRTLQVTYLPPLALWARLHYLRNPDALALAWHSGAYSPLVVRSTSEYKLETTLHHHVNGDTRPLLVVVADVADACKSELSSYLAQRARDAKTKPLFVFLVASDAASLAAMHEAVTNLRIIGQGICKRVSLLGAHLVSDVDALLGCDCPPLPSAVALPVMGRRVTVACDVTVSLHSLEVANLAHWQQGRLGEPDGQVLGWLDQEKHSSAGSTARSTMKTEALRAFEQDGVAPPLAVLARKEVAQRKVTGALVSLVQRRLQQGNVASTVHVLHCFTMAGASTMLRQAALELAVADGWVLLADGASFDDALREALSVLPKLLASMPAPVTLLVDDNGMHGIAESTAQFAASKLLHEVANAEHGAPVSVCVVFTTRWWPTRGLVEPMASVDLVLSPFLSRNERSDVLSLVLSHAAVAPDEKTIDAFMRRDLVHLMDVVALSGTAPREGATRLVARLPPAMLAWLSTMAALVLCASYQQRELWLPPPGSDSDLADCSFLLRRKDGSDEVSMAPHWAFSLLRTQEADYYRNATLFRDLAIEGLSQQLIDGRRFEDLKALLADELPLFVVAACRAEPAHDVREMALYMPMQEKKALREQVRLLVEAVGTKIKLSATAQAKAPWCALHVALHVFRSKLERRVRALVSQERDSSWSDPKPTGRAKIIVSPESDAAYRERMAAWEDSTNECEAAAEDAMTLKKRYKLQTLAPEEAQALARLHRGALDLARGNGGSHATASALRALMDLSAAATTNKDYRRVWSLASHWYRRLRSSSSSEEVSAEWGVDAIVSRLAHSKSEQSDMESVQQPLPIFDNDEVRGGAYAGSATIRAATSAYAREQQRGAQAEARQSAAAAQRSVTAAVARYESHI